MEDFFEIVSGLVIRKNHPAQCGAIEIARPVDHVVPEALSDFVQSRLSRRNKFSGDDIRIDYGDTERGEHVRDGGLAAGDAAGQADFQAGVRS